MRDDEAQRRKVAEQIAFDELHERRRVGVDVMRTRRMEVRIARRRYVDHRRHVERDHLLVERIPMLVGERRRLPMAARRVGIEIAADEAQLGHAALQLRNRVGDRHARRLRQLAHTDEVFRIQVDDTLDEVVACARPGGRSRLVADVVRHRRRTRRKNRDVCATLALQLELVLLDRLADLVIADAPRRRHWQARVLEARKLLVPELLMRVRSSRVVAVAVDDQHQTLPRLLPSVIESSMSFRSSCAAAVRCAEAQSCHTAHALLIRGSKPASPTVRATSRISSARRRP